MACATKLYRSGKEKLVSGVCGGVAEYFNIDVALVRIGWAFSILFYGVGLVLYLIVSLIVPKNPEHE